MYLVADNLNTALRSSFEDVMDTDVTADIRSRIEFRGTSVHAGRLNIAEIEFGILELRCLARGSADQATLTTDVDATTQRRSMWNQTDVCLARRGPEAS